MDKGVVDSAVAQAKKFLKLDDKYSNADLRTAYRSLARLFHPDKNPNGRETFEGVKKAYELLCSIEMHVAETDLSNVLLLIKTQSIIYRRFNDRVCDQQYPAYKLLVSVITVPRIVSDAISDLDFELLDVGTVLIYQTCVASIHNALEFVQMDCLPALLSILTFLLRRIKSDMSPPIPDSFLCALRALIIISSLEDGKEALCELSTDFAMAIKETVELVTRIPSAAEAALEIIANCASLQGLQMAFTNVGIIWKLVPFALVTIQYSVIVYSS
jgi:DnaJ family protein C protein 13